MCSPTSPLLHLTRPIWGYPRASGAARRPSLERGLARGLHGRRRNPGGHARDSGRRHPLLVVPGLRGSERSLAGGSDAVYVGFGNGTNADLAKIQLTSGPPLRNSPSIAAPNWYTTSDGGAHWSAGNGPLLWVETGKVRAWSGAGTQAWSGAGTGVTGVVWSVHARIDLSRVGVHLGLGGALARPYRFFSEIDIGTRASPHSMLGLLARSWTLTPPRARPSRRYSSANGANRIRTIQVARARLSPGIMLAPCPLTRASLPRRFTMEPRTPMTSWRS
jgi:hypothetical protein